MKNDWQKIIPGVIISAICLALLFYFVDLRQMATALLLADYRLVILVFVITLIWLLIRMMVWRTLLQEQATYSQVFLTLNEGYLLNNLLPFRLGEVGRAFLLSRKAHLQFMQVFSTILIERGLDVAFAAGLLLSTLPFVIGARWALQAASIAGGIVVLGLIVLYLFARNQAWVVQKFESVSQRWPIIARFGGRQLNAFSVGLSVLTDGRRFLLAVGWMVVNWLVAIVQFSIAVLAFFPDARLLWGAFTLAVTALGIAAPSSPGAVGVMEISMVGALSLFGLDPSIALAAALTAHLTNYLVTGVIGIYALARDGLTLTDLYKDVRSLQPGANQ